LEAIRHLPERMGNGLVPHQPEETEGILLWMKQRKNSSCYRE